MSATTLSTTFGGIAGSDLEAELAQPRVADHDENEAFDAERNGATHHALEWVQTQPRGKKRGSGGDETLQAAGALARNNAHKAAHNIGDYAVQLRGVGKRYGERQVLSDFDLSIERGSFVAIVGRSGCGKSTLLRLVAGLEETSSGALEKRAEDGGPLDTRIMFQDARLLPWKSVLQNVMLGLGRGAREDARAVLAEVGLLERADDWPAQLSGGQRQRVALARALVHRPQLLLLDEPLGALDALTRIEMHALIERLWREHRFTALLVTHDVHEAVALGDRILLIEEGRIALDQPVALERPRARASAGFAALEEHVLQRVLKTGPNDDTLLHRAYSEPAKEQLTRPTDVRWAI
ncbi:ATP-binding cassette domain-containing protein [Paraburkholderia susongensis]|uniref:Sulfonate transport system ATP-binding protein n=1 Tax=Paraburkholderia susongensis TaxID=1515439 RepID=A0A1X7JDF2_9BURK|nr:ATP-binding cassette domain-containing protein [Paraburkholderia susongensis]SMG25724.1 sulfonate transport system ATP-binding protein [Paraburkholderia susongensis]